MRAGLVSVTFRQLGIEEIVEIMDRARLSAVEWGGDVHVTDKKSALKAKELCGGSGIEILSLGSYFRVTDDIDELKRSLELADILGAGMVRIWCGRHGSKELDSGGRARVIDALGACCEAAEGKLLALEFHGGTLTDSLLSVTRLMDETKEMDNLRFHWQPRWDWPYETNLEALEAVRSRIGHMHVFCWEHTAGEIIRRPLEDGKELLRSAFDTCRADALLEFVKDDSIEQLISDANTLNRMMNI